MLGTIRAFWNDQRGIAMILVAIMLPVLVGFALLAIDMSRANSLHNDMQKGADAFVLAAAAELDGNTDYQGQPGSRQSSEDKCHEIFYR
ncbi:pilus assembly protein TadG-related protein [Mesorhizobium sp. M0802]|uniref:TadE/TadG family type IV pilus assembly protein n=1 Tax=Mesorhizobium sp. M0802 TaxID=2957001 RepID=UPI00333E04F4